MGSSGDGAEFLASIQYIINECEPAGEPNRVTVNLVSANEKNIPSDIEIQN